MRTERLRLAVIAAGLLAVPAAVPAHVDAGEPVEPVELNTITGERHALLARNVLNVLVFFRPGNERSVDTLLRVADCEKVLAGKPVHMVGVVSSAAPLADVRAVVAETGVKSPILLDEGDVLYGKLELRQHPVIVIVDRKNKVAAVEPYQRLRYCEIIRARVGFLLGEMDQAAVDRVLKPERAAFPGEVGGASAARYVNLGDRERAKGNCAPAIKAYDEALRRDPLNAKALEGRTRCGATTAIPGPKK